jgi:uncharacterized protein (DUF488 family)
MTSVATLGHGTLTADVFAALARDAGVETVVDVRRFPGSRRLPHFASEAMATWLPEQGLGYRWIVALGGRRPPDPDSPNVLLRNPQFRGYADHMASAEFAAGVGELLALMAEHRVAVMCAESVWWRCHRRLLADHLVLVAGAAVEHVFHDHRVAAHPVTTVARVLDEHVVYDAGAPVHLPFGTRDGDD